MIAVREYPPAFTQEFLNQIQGVPPQSATGIFILDAVLLRDAVRACKGQKPSHGAML